jgi:type IV pilus assembly protein PilC
MYLLLIVSDSANKSNGFFVKNAVFWEAVVSLMLSMLGFDQIPKKGKNMPYYSWSGITLQGSMIRGSAFAVSQEALQERLFTRNIALIRCKQQRNIYVLPISDEQKVELFEQLGLLLAAGIHLVQALLLVCQQLSDVRMATIVEHLANLVRQGHQLHVAMAQYPRIFSDEMIHMMQVGAQAGNLPLALAALSEHVRAQQQFKKRLRTALIVPAVTALFFLIIFVVTLFALVPRYAELFTSMGKPLPWLTQILFSTYQVLSGGYAVTLLSLAALMLLGAMYASRTPATKRWFDGVILRVPWIGPLVQDIAMLQLFRSLALLQQGGMSVVPAMEIAVCAIDNTVLRADLMQVIVEVRAGHPLSTALQGVLSERREAILLITIGEESGTLPLMVKKIAALYDERVLKKLRHYTLLVQPICMIVLGVLVALLIVAVYMPLFDLADLV